MPVSLFPGRPPAESSAAGTAARVAELVAAGRTVALEPGTAGRRDVVALMATVAGTGCAASCRITVATAGLSDVELSDLADRASDLGLAIDLAGPLDRSAALGARIPAAGVVLPATAPAAERSCRALGGGRVRLVGRTRRQLFAGAAADLAYVRCLNVLMAAGGHPGVATADPRLVAIAGERAAWHGRSADSWEYVVTPGMGAAERRRLLALGQQVRVTVRTGGQR